MRRRHGIEMPEIPLALPRLPAALAGLRLAQVTDTHIRRPVARHDAILHLLADARADLIALTGDIMHRPGHEAPALAFLRRLTDAITPRHGYVGCFGNHDTTEFKRRARDLPVTWLEDAAIDHPDLPVTLAGVNCEYEDKLSGDAVSVALALANGRSSADDAAPEPAPSRLRVLLAHLPSWLPAAAAMGFDLVLMGHTHGGQCRLPGARVVYNSLRGWPLGLSTGRLSMGRTTAVISRGLGESVRERLRVCCPPMLPIYRLTGGDGQPPRSRGPRRVARW